MRDAASGGAGLSFARVEVEGRLASKAVAFLRPLQMQPANVNSALNSLAAAGPADWNADAGTGGGIASGYPASGKRVLDLLLVLLSLPVVLPLVAVCAAALWLEGGQPFYTQVRLGRGGHRFRILKLRTMVRDADRMLQHCLVTDPALRREWDETQKLKNDPRITRVGRILRATSLDELPQLWNVAKGEMSLVGPRPMMPEQLPLYGDARAYFALRPGLTGLWQVSVRNEGSFASRARADADYRRGLSLAGDLVLIWRTAGVVLKGTGY